MFKIIAEPKFEIQITLVGQGREQVLTGTFKHMIRTAYMDLLKAVQEGNDDAPGVILKIMEKWDADLPLTRDSIGVLEDNQPGACWAIIGAYGDSLMVERKGN